MAQKVRGAIVLEKEHYRALVIGKKGHGFVAVQTAAVPVDYYLGGTYCCFRGSLVPVTLSPSKALQKTFLKLILQIGCLLFVIAGLEATENVIVKQDAVLLLLFNVRA